MIIRSPVPPALNIELARSGAMLVLSQLSACVSVPLCASSFKLGTMNEKLGKLPFTRSVENCVNGTRLFFSLLLATSEKYGKGLCRLTEWADRQPMHPKNA